MSNYKSNLQMNNSALSSNNADLQSLIEQVDNLPDAGSGVELPELLNPANEGEVFLNKEYINANGVKKSGTFTIDTELTSQDELISQIQTALLNKASAAPIEPVLQSKTATPTTSQQTITPDSSYDGLSQVVIEAIQTQTKTVTPSAANKTVTPDTGKFLTSVTVNGDANLVSDNIKSGVSIFGVSGAYVGSGSSSSGSSEDTEILNGIIDGSISSYTNTTMSTVRDGLFMKCGSLTTVNIPECKRVGGYAFYECSELDSAVFPKCSRVNDYAFYACSKMSTISFPTCGVVYAQAFARCSSITEADLPSCSAVFSSGFASCKNITSINFPTCLSVYNYAFNTCDNLTDVNLPACKILLNSAFSNCYSLSTMSLPAIEDIRPGVFMKCYNLKSLYLTGSTVCKLSNSNAFTSTPIGGYSGSAGAYGSIFVPASLLTSYKAATNWTYFSNRMVGV